LALAKTFFGEEGAIKFLDLVGEGSAKIKALREEGRITGHVLKNELFDQGEKLNKDVERLEHKIGVDLKKAVIDFAPAWKFALEAVVEIQMAVDKLLSSVRIGGFRVGPGVSATQRLDELDRDIAEAERKATQADQQRRRPDKFSTATSRGAEEAGKLRQDIERMRTERAGLIDRASAEAAARQGAASAAEQDAMLAGITITPKKKSVDLSGKGTAQAESFRKLMLELDTEAKKARASLDPLAQAAFDLDQKLQNIGINGGPKAKEAMAKLAELLEARGQAALQQFSAESENLAKIAEAEAAGRKDLVAVLETELALRQRFGDKFVKDNAAQIEALAKTRFALEQLRERQRGAMQELEQTGRDVFLALGGNANEFFDKQIRGWDLVRNRAINVLNIIAAKLQEVAANDLFRALGFDVKGPGLGDLLGAAGRLLSGIGGGGASTGFETIVGGIAGGIAGFAEGGRPPVGVPSIVGERGIEMFVPDVAGTIVPNSALGGNTILIDARDAADPAATERAVQRGIVKAAPWLIDASVKRVRDTNARDPRFLPR
jgi:hypothetical protein